METHPVEMEIQALTITGNFKESVLIVVQRVKKRPTVGKRKKMLTSARRIGSRGMLELKLMQAM